jgi:EAL domain-containing protein (putative c-di-GMP-specific phosphodiesterase class I)
LHLFVRAPAASVSSPAPLPLRAVARSGALFVALQPIVDLDTGEIFGQEILLRGSAPGFHTPAEIIRAALDESFMGEMGRDIRRMAVSAVPDTRLFLNIHPAEFAEGWLVRPDDPMFTH